MKLSATCTRHVCALVMCAKSIVFYCTRHVCTIILLTVLALRTSLHSSCVHASFNAFYCWVNFLALVMCAIMLFYILYWCSSPKLRSHLLLARKSAYKWGLEVGHCSESMAHTSASRCGVSDRHQFGGTVRNSRVWCMHVVLICYLTFCLHRSSMHQLDVVAVCRLALGCDYSPSANSLGTLSTSWL